MAFDRLADALDRLEAMLESPRRWAQGGAVRDDKRCVLTATNVVLPKDQDMALRFDVYNEVLVAADRPWASRPDSKIVEWNDEPERTHESVLAAIRKAAASRG